MIRPFALAKQLSAVPFHFLRHQWRKKSVGVVEKHQFGPHPRQYLLLWMPPGDVLLQQHIVVFYHGGGWRLGWPDQFPTLADWFLTRGYPVIMPGYRLRPRFSFPEMREDLALTLQKIMALREERAAFEGCKLLIGGMSAGGTLAAHMLFNRSTLAEEIMQRGLFSGFISLAGPLDLDKLPNVAPLRGFAGGPHGSAPFKAANPITHLNGQEQLPMILVHGTDDAIVPYLSSVSFFERYQGPKTFHTVEGGSHLDALNFALDDLQASNALELWLKALD